MPAQSATIAVLSGTAATADDLHVDAADCSRLLQLLELVPDPRKRRGVRHSVAAILAIAAAAVLAGSRSVLAIGEWAAEAPQVVLRALGARFHPITGRFSAAHVDTFRRVLRSVDAEAVDTAIGVFLAERAGLRVSDCPPGGAEGSAEHGHDHAPRHDHASQPDGQQPDSQQPDSQQPDSQQPDSQHSPEQDKPTTRGLAVDGKTVRGGHSAGRACGAPVGGDGP